MKLSALTYSKGTLSPHYLAFALLAPISALMGIGLAPSINWFYAVLLCIALYITYSIAHCVHDIGHADSSYKTLSRKGLKILAIVLSIMSAGFIVYFTVAISLWILAFAAAIPLCVLYRRGLVYSPFCFSGGLAVCVLGGYFVMTETISLPAVLMAIFILLFGHAGLMLYKIDEWATQSVGVVPTNSISKESYSRAVNYLSILVLSLAPLTIALLLH